MGQKAMEIRKHKKYIEDAVQRHFYLPQKHMRLHHQYLNWEEIINFRYWIDLQLLQLLNCQIKGPKVIVLQNNCWLSLISLSLQQNPIGSTGIKILIRIDLPNLEVLDIYQCQIGDEGIKYLVKGHWPKLTNLEVGSNMAVIFGLFGFQLGQWKNLKMLDVSEWKVRINKFISLMALVLSEGINIKITNQISNRALWQSWNNITISRFNL